MKFAKLFFVTMSALSTVSVWAGQPLKWTELLGDTVYPLQQKIYFEDEKILFRAGERFRLLSIGGLGGIPVVFAEFEAEKCNDPSAVAEMILVSPLPPLAVGTQRDNSVGVELKPGCKLQMYIELADYPTISLFEE